MAMYQHVAGRVRKVRLGASDALHALFEAIANSIDAIETSRVGNRVEVRVDRDTSKPVMKAKNVKIGRHPLLGFEVVDNGPGFDDKNLDCFKQSDYTLKQALGAKGEGRFSWLKVFDRAEIDSVFESGGTRTHRTFSFSVHDDGVTSPRDAQTTEPRGTTVRLMEPLSGYDKYLDKDPELLARAMLDHHAVYFLSEPAAEVWLVDESADYKECLNGLFADETGKQVHSESFEVNGVQFTAHHFTKKGGGKNLVTLCAAKRAVADIDMGSLSVDLGEPLPGSGGSGRQSYRLAVTGQYLDEIVDGERTGFKFSPDSALPVQGEVTRKELFDRVRLLAEQRQQEHLEYIRGEKAKRVERIVNEQCPHLRPFLEVAKPKLAALPLAASDRAVEVTLYEAKVDDRALMESRAEAIVQKSSTLTQVNEVTADLIRAFVTEANRHNVSALAEYVCTRQAVLSVLRANLGTDSRNKNQLELAIHDLFFPRGHTSAAVSTGPQHADTRRIDNLWIIDERLVFHSLLASDLPLNKLQRFVSADADEADIVVFNPAFISTDDADLRSVALIEFKRPGRKQYGDGEKKNPIQQLIGLGSKLRRGEFKDITGASRRLPEGAMIYGYAICDVTDKLKELTDTLDMVQTPDGEGYYYFHKKHGMMIEVISYQKLIRDAERRNAAFSRELGLR